MQAFAGQPLAQALPTANNSKQEVCDGQLPVYKLCREGYLGGGKDWRIVDAGGHPTDWASWTEVWCLRLRQLAMVLGAGWNAQTATSRTVAHVPHDCYRYRRRHRPWNGCGGSPFPPEHARANGCAGTVCHGRRLGARFTSTRLSVPPTRPSAPSSLHRRQTQHTVIGTPEVEYGGTMTMRTARTRPSSTGGPVASPPIDASPRAWSARRTVATLQHALEGADWPARPEPGQAARPKVGSSHKRLTISDDVVITSLGRWRTGLDLSRCSLILGPISSPLGHTASSSHQPSSL
jgi:hypothetical protein